LATASAQKELPAMDRFEPTASAFLARPERRSRLAAALSLLRDAWEAAQDVRRSPWEFAVKREEFQAAGIADTYLLWLMARRYAEKIHRQKERRHPFPAGPP
jgi:hypothetical protein